MNYLLNCFWLLIPVLLFNIIFMKLLPEPFQKPIWDGIPPLVGRLENIFRGIVFTLPLIMQLNLRNNRSKVGLICYLVGVVIYFASWLIQIYLPDSAWSKSVWGFTAPAYTTMIWFVGIAMIGRTLVFSLPYHYSIYLILSAIFVVVHSIHAYLVYLKI